MQKPVYIIGDVHGKVDALQRIIDEHDIKDCIFICVGDLGIGFKQDRTKDLRGIAHFNKFLAPRNIHFLSIRGNHDDPSYFIGKGRVAHSHVELLDDYTLREINGEKFLFVGGAVSIDRQIRKEGVSYWSDEKFVLDTSKIARCDVLITHSAPSWNGPCDKDGIRGWCEKDPTLWDECLQERKEHDILIKLTGARKHYCGHFHTFSRMDHDDCRSYILDELEIMAHRNVKA
jgi:UDP-2,3-diacylglucosamine pyrophosphatase LpxH